MERSSSLQLATDEEREDFVERFWVRRNPNSQSEENTFEEEYYRRILYANEQFGSSIPGSKTDRGRIYVALGPPDEIEIDDHAGGRIGSVEGEFTVREPLRVVR